MTELKHAWRSLLKAPGYSSACILILAAGIGLSLYMFGAINGFILKPLPFADGERLVHLEAARSQDPGRSGEPSLHDYLDLRREQRVLTGLHAYDEGTINLSDGVRPERYDGAFVSGEAFSALGLEPLMGRNFSAADELPGAPKVALIGYQLWQNRFGGAADIVGQAIRLNGEPATVVGVMPQGFRFPRMHQIWTLLDMGIAQQPRSQSRGVEIFGHLAPGQTLASAQQAFAGLMATLAKQHPDTTRGDLAVLKPYADEFINPTTRKILFTMLVAVVLVLLIACANVANLMVVRGSFRAREMAVRSAIGAGRARLILGVLSEAALIALAAGAIGWIGAQWGGALTIEAIRSGEDPPVYWVDFAIDGWAYLFTAVAVAVATLAAGLYPALRASRQASAPELRDGGHGATDRRSGRLTRTLVLAEIAFCTALLCAAGLTVRSVMEIQAVPTGAQLEGVLSGRLGMFPGAYPEAADRAEFVDRLQRELQAIPGVQAAAVTSAVPMQAVGSSELLLEGEVLPPAGERGQVANHSVVTPGYFEVYAVPLLAGRDFSSSDRADTQPVAIVSQSLASELWPQREALGQRLKVDPRDPASPWLTVVGVVGDVMMDMEEFG
ncbi:MAG: ABC transporter permease, partial [Xanthomonadales bacterium]|nr:ABC transporter permease [Xanthomonadales bacterium]